MSKSRRRLRQLIVSVGSSLLSANVAFPADKTWIGPAIGSWSVSANWNPAGQPVVTDNVFLTQSDATNRTVIRDLGATATTFGTLLINATGTGSILLNAQQGAFGANNLLIGTNGLGHMTSSKVVTAVNLSLGSAAGGSGFGTFAPNTSSATMSVSGSFVVGGAGTGSWWQQAAGFTPNVSTGTVILGQSTGSSGRYILEAGTLNVGSGLVVGAAGSGTFLSFAGATLVTPSLTVGSAAGGSGYFEVGAPLTIPNTIIGGLGAGTLFMSLGSSANLGSLIVGQSAAGTVFAEVNTLSVSGAVFGNGSGGTGTLNAQFGTFTAGAGSIVFGRVSGSSGRMVINGGNVTAGTIFFGGMADGAADGSAIGTISNGVMNVTHFQLGSGDSSTSDATLTISGGVAGIGTLGIGVGTSSIGTLNLSGGFLAVSNRTVIADDFGAGRITQSSGTLSSATLLVGAGQSSSGTFSLSGGFASMNSQIDVAAGTLAFGRIVHSGGTFSASNRLERIGVGENSDGTLALSGTAVHNVGTLLLGVGNGAFGTMTISGGALNIGGGTSIFSIGAVGSGRAVQSGGFVDVNGTLAIASTISGTGSYSISAGSMEATNLLLGRSGSGALSISAGTVNVASDALIGMDGGTGTLVLSGTGQATFSGLEGLRLGSIFSTPGAGFAQVSGGTLNITAGSFALASNGGSATLEQSGGRIRVTDANFGDIQLGNTNGSAQFTMTGGQTEARALAIGVVGNATFIMSDGTLTLASQFTLGNNVGSLATSGFARQTGGVITTTSLRPGVGSASIGTFIMSGGSFTASGAISQIGTFGGQGTVLLSGNAAMSLGSLDIGSPTGSGWVSLDDAPSLSATALRLLDGGRLFINGGTVSASTLTVTPTALANGATLSFTAGRLQLTSPLATLTLGSGQLLGSALALTPTRQLSTQGTLSLAAQSLLDLNGGRLEVGTLVMGADATFRHNAGTLAIVQSDLSLGSAAPAPLGASLVLTGGKALALASGRQLNVWSDGLLEAAGGYVDAGGTLAIAAGGQARVSAPGGIVKAINLDNNGVFEVAGGRADFQNVSGGSGEIALTAPSAVISAASQFSNTGLLRGNGAVNTGSFNNTASGRIRVSSGESLRILSPVDTVNNGTIELLGGELDFAGGSLNNNSRITGRGQLVAAVVNNTGTTTLSAGVSDIIAALNNSSAGKTIVTGGANATFHGAVNNTGTSEFRVSTNSTATFLGPVSGLSAFTGPGTKIFEDTASFGRIVTAGGSTSVGPAGSVVTEHIREAALSIEGNFALLPDSAPTGTSRLTALAIAGAPSAWEGSLDLASNALVIDYIGASPLNMIADQLRSGRNGGAWNGTGIHSSSAAAVANRAIGYAEGSDIGAPASFVGQPADGTSILLRYTLPGDADLNGSVTIGDFALVAANFNAATKWSKGDFNYDGVTNIADFALLAANFNQSLPTDLSRQSIPEPTAAVLLALVSWILRRAPARDLRH